MFDQKKHLAIISSPRVGSTWYQLSMSQYYSMSELFHPDVPMTFLDNSIIYPSTHDDGFDTTVLDKSQRDIERLHYRYQQFKNFERCHKRLSVKIHAFLLRRHSLISDFIANEDFQIVILDRKDKLSTLLSQLIVASTGEYQNAATPQEITVTHSTFSGAIQMMYTQRDIARIILNKYPGCALIYYEDTLNYSPSEWWQPTKFVSLQNAKAVTNIINKRELDQWISDVDWASLAL